MKSLAQRLARFVNPAPEEADPEDEVKDSGSSSESENEEARAHYVDVGKSRLRDDQPELDSKFAAKRVSRDEKESPEASESEESEASDAELVEASESEEELSEASEEEAASGSEDEEEASEASDVEQAPSKSAKSQPTSAVSQLLQQEQKQLLTRLSSATNDDAAKGEAVCGQIKTYEQLLDSRITLQKALVASHEPVEADDRAEALEAVTSLLASIHNARARLSGSSETYKKRSFSEMAEDAAALDSELAKRRETTLTKWSRKVQLSNANLSSSNFKSLNQSSAKQVSSVLADMDRLVQRTQVNRSKYAVGGEVPETSESIFDDTDFYRTLLTDLIDRRMAEKEGGDALKWTAAKTKTKTRKKMDTSLSKNRRINYDVHDKLVAFDAPRPGVYAWTEQQADELFAGLLGVKIGLDDEEPEEAEEVEDVGEFNLFG